MKRILSVSIIIVLFTMIFQSCQKGSNVQETFQSQVEFTFSTGQLKNVNEQGLTNVVVTIEDSKGKVVRNSEKIEIYNMNGNYLSKPISLVTGEYKLTRFLVLNASNNVVYCSPTGGSAKAYLVQKPLPISFSTQKDVVTKLTPEVLCTAESRPEDFGYATFSFEIAKTFDFLVGAAIYNDVSKNFDLTTASISLFSNTTLVYSGQLAANTTSSNSNYDPLGITNKITLPEKYNSYTINISKAGYVTYNKTFTKDELRLYYRKEDKGSLVVILEKNAIQIPVLSTTTVSAIAQTSATSGGNVTSDGGSQITALGICWNTSPNPTISNNKSVDGTGTGSFTCSIIGLTANTMYYVRAYATNIAGTAYGNEISFITSTSGGNTVTDIEGNVYNTVTIGTQVWMTENLRTTKYNDGTEIPNVINNLTWAALITPAYCWHNNDAATYKATYGALYNWYAVEPASNGNKNICPVGWHVPAKSEWTTLITYLGGESVAGGKMKESGTTHWIAPNTGSDNSSGFTAIPVGGRGIDGVFILDWYGCWWWSSDYFNAENAFVSWMTYENTSVHIGNQTKSYGNPIRCIKD